MLTWPFGNIYFEGSAPNPVGYGLQLTQVNTNAASGLISFCKQTECLRPCDFFYDDQPYTASIFAIHGFFLRRVLSSAKQTLQDQAQYL